MLFRVLFLLFFYTTLKANIITFALLSTQVGDFSVKEYSPMIEYLSRKTKMKFEILILRNIEEMRKELKKNRIALLFIDPLTYVKIKDEYKDIVPMVSFRSSNGKTKTTCSIITTDESIKRLKDISGKRFAITDDSTICGYLMSENMLNKENLSLKNIDYVKLHSTTDLVMSVILQEYTAGTIQTDIARKYESMGIRFLSYSSEIPGFILSANSAKISIDNINLIKKLLLKLDIKKIAIY
jgi:ABC-type phosphate/phosphonate transport system substrate-binding protein